jgi:hypothetical protein
METREVRLKADNVTVTFERTAEDKIHVTTTSWDDAKVILPNQVLEAAVIGKPSGSTNRLLTWTSTTPGLLKRVTVRKRNRVTVSRDVTVSRRNALRANDERRA